MWQKLLINAVANPVTALTRQRQTVLRRDDVRALYLAVLDEAAAVARADGARLTAGAAEQTLSTLLTIRPMWERRCTSTFLPHDPWRLKR
jgi:2-dehydropantoate 2-reductase